MDLTRAPIAPSRRLAVLFGAGFTAITTESLPIGLLPVMSRSLHVSEGAIGLLTGVYALVVMVVTLPLVALTSRWPRRRLLLVVMCGFVVSNLVTACAPSYGAILVARVLAAFGHGVLWSTMPAYAAALVAPHPAGRAIAVVFAANAASLTIGVPLGTVVGATAGWRVSFTALAGLAAIIMLLARARLPECPGAAARMPAISDAVRLPALRPILATTGLVMLGHFTLYTFVAPVLLDAGLSHAQLGPALFTFGLAGVIGIVAAGTTADRAPRIALSTALMAQVLSVAAVGLTREGVVLMAVAGWGAAYAALPTLLQTAILKSAPRQQASASALFIIMFNFSITVGSTLGGQLLSWKGPSALPIAAALFAAVAACLSLLGAPTTRLSSPSGPSFTAPGAR